FQVQLLYILENLLFSISRRYFFSQKQQPVPRLFEKAPEFLLTIRAVPILHSIRPEEIQKAPQNLTLWTGIHILPFPALLPDKAFPKYKFAEISHFHLFLYIQIKV